MVCVWIFVAYALLRDTDFACDMHTRVMCPCRKRNGHSNDSVVDSRNSWRVSPPSSLFLSFFCQTCDG